jgi:AbrB family looped-hinge helix DNA binding protein
MSKSDETTVNESFSVTVPAAVREQLDLEPGDKIRWTATEDGGLSVEVVQQQYGVLDDVEPVDMGETDAVEVEREFGAE